MKNKNFLKRLSAMITALCIMIPLSTASNIGTVNSADFDVIDIYNSWQEAYRDELISFMNYGSYASKDSSGSDLCSMYEVYDMNEDGVPELFISEGAYHTSTVHAYTFTDGMVKELFYGGEYGSISFVPSKSYSTLVKVKVPKPFMKVPFPES